MITIEINQEEETTQDMVLYMEHISQLISQGYTSGEGWSIKGIDEKEVE